MGKRSALGVMSRPVCSYTHRQHLVCLGRFGNKLALVVKQLQRMTLSRRPSAVLGHCVIVYLITTHSLILFLSNSQTYARADSRRADGWSIRISLKLTFSQGNSGAPLVVIGHYCGAHTSVIYVSRCIRVRWAVYMVTDEADVERARSRKRQ